MVTEATIQEAVRRIAEQFHPVKVILFGSQARGMADQHSDVDLIVVVDGAAPRSLFTQIHHALSGLRMAKDIVIFTVDEYERERALPGFVRVADKEGRVMYARAA